MSNQPNGGPAFPFGRQVIAEDYLGRESEVESNQHCSHTKPLAA